VALVKCDMEELYIDESARLHAGLAALSNLSRLEMRRLPVQIFQLDLHLPELHLANDYESDFAEDIRW
jgi:hypothetical protein